MVAGGRVEAGDAGAVGDSGAALDAAGGGRKAREAQSRERSEAAIATSVPVPIAIPRSACARSTRSAAICRRPVTPWTVNDASAGGDDHIALHEACGTPLEARSTGDR